MEMFFLLKNVHMEVLLQKNKTSGCKYVYKNSKIRVIVLSSFIVYMFQYYKSLSFYGESVITNNPFSPEKGKSYKFLNKSLKSIIVNQTLYSINGKFLEIWSTYTLQSL